MKLNIYNLNLSKVSGLLTTGCVPLILRNTKEKSPVSNNANFFVNCYYIYSGAGKLSRYSDWLLAGRSGDRIPVAAKLTTPFQSGPGVHPDSCTKDTNPFPGIKSGRGVTLTPHPFLVSWSQKRRAISLFPYGPYCLYRASAPVQRCTLTLPIPLLPLWAVRPVQSLSASTTVHFTITYTSTPPYGPYGLYRASVPVQRCTLPLPIPPLPLWAVRPVQSLSACTTVHFTFTYTSTTPMDRTACTEPQILYNGAL